MDASVLGASMCASPDPNVANLYACTSCSAKVSTSKCGGCYSVWYCGARCQKTDWTAHRPVCARKERAACARMAPLPPLSELNAEPASHSDVQLLHAILQAVTNLTSFAPALRLIAAGASPATVVHGDFVEARGGIVRNMDIPSGQCALHAACGAVQSVPNAVKFLTAAAARAPLALHTWACLPVKPECGQQEFYTPIGAAISCSNFAIVDWLLAHAPTIINAPCALLRSPNRILTPLGLSAVYADALLRIPRLLAAGADADARCPLTGWSVLEKILSDSSGNAAVEECALALLAHGATADFKRPLAMMGEGRAIDYAGRKGYARVFEALIAKGSGAAPWALTTYSDMMSPSSPAAPMRMVVNVSLTYADFAAERGHAAVLRLALAAGLNPNHRSPVKIPLLFTATYYQSRGQLETVALLLDAGADVNAMYRLVMPMTGAVGHYSTVVMKEDGQAYDICVETRFLVADFTALDSALGKYSRSSVIHPQLVSLLRLRGAKTGVELGGRAPCFVEAATPADLYDLA